MSFSAVQYFLEHICCVISCVCAERIDYALQRCINSQLRGCPMPVGKTRDSECESPYHCRRFGNVSGPRMNRQSSFPPTFSESTCQTRSLHVPLHPGIDPETSLKRGPFLFRVVPYYSVICPLFVGHIRTPHTSLSRTFLSLLQSRRFPFKRARRLSITPGEHPAATAAWSSLSSSPHVRRTFSVIVQQTCFLPGRHIQRWPVKYVLEGQRARNGLCEEEFIKRCRSNDMRSEDVGRYHRWIDNSLSMLSPLQTYVEERE